MSEETYVFTRREIRAMIQHLRNAQAGNTDEIEETIKFLVTKQICQRQGARA